MSKGHRVCLVSLAAMLLAVSAEAAFEIDFMRHGETLWNRAKVLQGTTPYPQLSLKGVAVTEATAEGLAAAGMKYDRIFASPLARTRETADIVAAKTGPKPVVHALLRERCFGTAEGKRIPDGKTVKDLLAGASGVETEAEVAARVRAFLDEMKALDGKVERVLAVTHSHLLKGLILALRGEAFDNGTLLPNNCINTVRYEDGRFTLVSTGRIFYDAAAFDAIKQPRIIAHRGAGDLTMPEHSRAAYRDAVAKRCDIVKLDLHETKDGVIVLSHDDTLTREMGWNVDIKAVTYAEIMEKGVYREKGGVRGERIVRLDEALEIVRSVPEFWIDFKYYTPEFAERAIAEFAKAGIDLSRVMCATFTCVALTYLRTAHPEIRRIAHMGNRTDLKNFLEMKDYYDLWGINIGARTRIARPEGLVTEQPLETIAELKRRGLWVSLHSIGYAHEHAKYRASGCDAYVSDDVSVLRPLPFGSLAGGTYYVNNRTGDDANDGRSREHALRTLARAARMLGPGDVLEIAPGEPYRESLVVDASGTPERPVVIHGNGAVITGLEPIPNDSWKPVGDGVWFSANDACWGSLKPRLVDGAGREVEFKWDKAGVTCRTSDGQRPKDLYGYFRESGVKIEDHSNIVVENITAERFANDGFNIHGTCSNIVFRNIEARYNGDDGFSVHEWSQTFVDGGRFHHNLDGVDDVHVSQTDYVNVIVESNETFGVGFRGGIRTLKNAIVRDNADEPIVVTLNRVRLKGLDPSDPLNRATVRLENVKASGGTGDPIRVEKGCRVTKVDGFATLGAMIDVSRGRVLKVETLKTRFEQMRKMGYNAVMLYTEDTFRLEGEPKWGYMRGGYTRKDIRELKSCADGLGLAMIPCIETLGHLERVLRWSDYADVRNTESTLLVGEERTYALIDKMLGFWQEALGGSRIHLGMDEAFGFAGGRCRKAEGERDIDVFLRHLVRVNELCAKHGFTEPIIWSDMFYRLASKDHDYYDPEAKADPALAARIPKNVRLCYWDYYHDRQDYYEGMIDGHRSLGSEPILTGGIQLWQHFLCDREKTLATSKAFVEAAQRKGCGEFFFTLWGDDGGYAVPEIALEGLFACAELAQGRTAEPTEENCGRFRAITGLDYRSLARIGDACRHYADDWPDMIQEAMILYDDPLFCGNYRNFLVRKPSTNTDRRFYCATYGDAAWRDDGEKVMADYRRTMNGLRTGLDLPPVVSALIRTLAAKVDYEADILAAWRAEDRPALERIAAKSLPALVGDMREFMELYRSNWYATSQPFGFELIQNRNAAALARLEEAKRRLDEFLSGKVRTIEELDETTRPFGAYNPKGVIRW